MASKTTVMTLEVAGDHTFACIHLMVALKVIAQCVAWNATSVRAAIMKLYTVGGLNNRNGLSHFYEEYKLEEQGVNSVYSP